jgi:hypothetical protein
MPAASETGNAKNVANLSKMITFCTGYGAAYNPSNVNIALKALNAKYTESNAAVKAVEPFKKPYKDAINVRETQFNLLNPLVRSALSVLKAGDGVSATTVQDAVTLQKKITGTNRGGKAAMKPATDKAPASEGEPQVAKHSTSQQSYDMRLANFNDFVSLLSGEPSYMPNEADITTAALTTFANNLKTVNDAVGSVYGDYEKALKARDISLYEPGNGLVDLTVKVKNYVSGISSLGATDKKLVSGLKFTKPGKNFIHF